VEALREASSLQQESVGTIWLVAGGCWLAA
jgi:hypothetical protein